MAACRARLAPQTSSELVALAITAVVWLVLLFAPRVPSWLLWYRL